MAARYVYTFVKTSNGNKDAYSWPQLGPPDRLLPPVARRHSKLQHLPYSLSRQPEFPGYRTLTPAFDMKRSPNTTVYLHLEHPSGVS